ncbi:MAG TPA: CNNM domain-containing protein, partial [Alphaproteobacteria bacterium]|nr:CNNM domain-containing protein [Alphaproteobacteria bacterium]
MTTGIIISLVVIFFLLILSAFFSGSETALTAVSSARMHSAEKDGDKKAALVNKILSNKERMIGGLLLGNNIVNITASSLAAGTLISLFGDSGVVYASAAMTILVVIFSEVLPKTYALHHADNMARFVSPVVYAVIYVCAPVTAVITKIVRASLAIVGVDISKVQAGSHLEMLRGVIDMHTGPEEEVQKQRAMLRSILDLADVCVDEVMIHRKNVIMLDLDEPTEVLVDEIMKCPYSRIPLYRESPDDIVGVIHTKWLMRELKSVGGDISKINLETIANEPWFIPDT